MNRILLAAVAALAASGGVPGAAVARPAAPDPLAALTRGARAFRAGAYAEAQRALAGAIGRGLKNDDWARYLHAESAFFAGAIDTARADFEKIARLKQSRFAQVAAFRAADCLWSAGAHDAAATRYTQLTKKPPAAKEIDLAVARFRIARAAEERKRPAAASLYLALYRDSPAHPLAAEARSRLPRPPADAGASGAGAGAGGGAGASNRTAAAAAVSPEDLLRRAEALTRDRHWTMALDELGKLPADLPAPLKVERDYQMGMTKFQMRRDYPQAAQLLLAAAPSLTGDKAASALFHGTRALSRVDRDDEAIAGYKQVVSKFPSSRYAAEAQYLAGWLDYNRGRFADSLPALRATLDCYGSSAFADDAAWCVAFAHFQLGQLAEAGAALDRYARLAPTGMTADERTARVAYWRARFAAKKGAKDEAIAGYRDVSKRWPFSFYALAARARIGEALAGKERVVVELPSAAPTPAASSSVGAQDSAVARAQELKAAGMDLEGGWELVADEKGVLRRLGDRLGTRVLLERYLELRQFHRAYQLSESRNSGALGTAPEGSARLWWEAAYPRAYRELVERHGPAAANPDLLLYAIMRKESGYSPWEVSYADARGLLQMIPPTSARVAAEAGLSFQPDELYDPDTNLRLGAAYIGSLHKKFGNQIALTAGAYNSGPKAMARWCEQHGRHPMDEFVELVAFAQTREYIKRVLGIYSRYRHLYGPTPYELPMTVDARVAATGPDY